MKAVSTMSYLEQWQWFLSLRRGKWGDWGQQPTRVSLRHGTHYAYAWRMCRCVPCVSEERARHKRDNARITAESRAAKAGAK